MSTTAIWRIIREPVRNLERGPQVSKLSERLAIHSKFLRTDLSALPPLHKFGIQLQRLRGPHIGERVLEGQQKSSISKKVYFVRHGESVANVIRRTVGNEAANSMKELRDAKLTEAGRAQAAELQSEVPTWDPELVITSPLSRAIETGCIAFENVDAVKMVAHPSVTEFYDWMIENHGREPQELLSDEDLQSLDRFSSISFESVEPNWWAKADSAKRLSDFYNLLLSTPEERLVVVAHWGFLFNLVRHAAGMEVSVANASYIETEWKIHP